MTISRLFDFIRIVQSRQGTLLLSCKENREINTGNSVVTILWMTARNYSIERAAHAAKSFLSFPSIKFLIYGVFAAATVIDAMKLLINFFVYSLQWLKEISRTHRKYGCVLFCAKRDILEAPFL